MKTISVAISEPVHEEFRRFAKSQDRAVAELIRDAMRFYRNQRILKRSTLTEIPLLRDLKTKSSVRSTRAVLGEMAARHFPSGK